MFRQAQPLQAGMVPIYSQQAGMMPMQTTPAQTGFDISTILNLMIPMMMVVMMMKMMGGAMGGAFGGSPKMKKVEAIPAEAS